MSQVLGLRCPNQTNNVNVQLFWDSFAENALVVQFTNDITNQMKQCALILLEHTLSINWSKHREPNGHPADGQPNICTANVKFNK